MASGLRYFGCSHPLDFSAPWDIRDTCCGYHQRTHKEQCGFKVTRLPTKLRKEAPWQQERHLKGVGPCARLLCYWGHTLEAECRNMTLPLLSPGHKPKVHSTTYHIATQAPAMGVKAMNESTNHELDPLKLRVKAKPFLLTWRLSQVRDYSDGKMTKATG